MSYFTELEPLLTTGQIAEKVAELGKQITADYQGKSLLVVGILKGSIPFFADLIRHIDLPLKIDFMCLSSYGNKTSSSGEVKMVLDLGYPVEKQHLLIVEDIIDTGTTLQFLSKHFKDRGAASVKSVSLLVKPTNHEHHIDVDYYGFEIPGDFVVGYGLDAAEQYRNLPYVAVLPKSKHP